MSSEVESAPPAPPPAEPARTPPPARLPLWAMALPLACVVMTGALWWQTRAELSAMRATQAELIEVLDTIRGATTLDVSDAPALGADDAVVTLVEFSDYECPFCIRHFTQTMGEIDEKLIRTGRIQYVFKDFPIAQLHPEAIRAHQAAHCAAEQGRFWEIHTRLFSPAGSHTDAQLEAHAQAAGVDLGAYRECMTSNRTVDEVQASVETAVRLGANGTPAFFVGIRDPETNQVRILQAISGAQPYAEFERVIAAVEARVER